MGEDASLIRDLPPSVTLLRHMRAEPTPLTQTAPADVERWLLREALGEDDMMVLFDAFGWRLRAAGVPIDRASLHVGTLHPHLLGFAWNWSAVRGRCEEVQVAPEVLGSDAFRRNPLEKVIVNGGSVKARVDDPLEAARFPLLAELAAEGFTDYRAIPLHAAGQFHNATTAATRQAGGFTEEQVALMDRLVQLFALHVERHIVLRIARNVTNAYVGPLAGTRVLDGNIRRGEGEAIRAVVWLSDMRGYTALSESLAGTDMITLLNAYFERLTDAVIANGGEVLKFLGDGVLAVFPFADGVPEGETARAALAAAEAARASLADLCAAPPEALAAIPGWRGLRTVFALHAGEVFFGNVGASERLDFTVIGAAVNTVSRVETAAKSLDVPIVLTAPVAEALRMPLVNLGEHRLRGMGAPLSLYAPAEG